MNAYQSKEVRKKYKATWQEEFIVGMIAHLGLMSTKRVLLETGYDGLMSPATAHKYLHQAIKKKLLTLKQSRSDGRAVEIDITEKGKKFLDEIKHSRLKLNVAELRYSIFP